MLKRLIINWLLSAVALLLTAYIMPGFRVDGFLGALAAAVMIGLVNGTLGALLKFFTFPLTLLTLGLFWFVINALMLMVASWLTPGFEVRDFFTAFVGALLLSLINVVLHWITPGD